MKKLLLSICTLYSALIIFSCNNGNSPGATANSTGKDAKEMAEEQNKNKIDSTAALKADADWAVKVADGGMLEVQLANLALTNAAAQKVKDFAKMMVDDHTKINDELKQAAAQKNITLPAALSDKSQKKYDDLAAKKGADFDKAYINAMIDDHQEDIDEFKKESADGKDADLKTWAANKLPTLQGHLDMAKTTKDGLKK